jgi:hypothetical protein
MTVLLGVGLKNMAMLKMPLSFVIVSVEAANLSYPVPELQIRSSECAVAAESLTVGVARPVLMLAL